MRRKFPPLGPLCWLLCLAAFLALAARPGEGLAKKKPDNGRARGLRYQVAFEGVDDKRLLDLLWAVSTASSQSGKPVDSIFLLRGRVKNDVPKLEAALKSQGRFAAEVASSVDESASPVMVHFTMNSIEPFLIRSVDVEPAPGAAPADLPPAGELGLKTGDPAVSKDIVGAANKILETLMNGGHPFPVLVEQKVVADFATHGVRVAYVVDPGPRAAFGPARFTGLTEVREGYVRSLVPWREGEEYRRDLVDQFRRKLLDLGLFAEVTAEPEKQLEEGGRVPVKVEVKESKMRTVKAGVYYKTDEGPGASVFWEHRNLMGQGERLRLSASASPITQNIEASFDKPGFLSPRQKLQASFKAEGQNTKAYQGQNVTAQAGLGRALTDTLSANAGAGYRVSRIQEDAANPQENNKRWGLAFIPLELAWNTRDDVLDPTKGHLLGVKAAPYLDTLGRDLSFVKAEISGAQYLKLSNSPRLVLALRAGLGSITGAQAKDIPPDVRFYAGGSATIRGYGYQLVGPLRGSKPLGGDSLFDFGGELRLQVTDLIGVVAFLDGGNVYKQSFPEFGQGQGMLFGAGTGLRVKTPVGPVRVDVAIPLDRRRKVDDAFQLYIGLGQAF